MRSADFFVCDRVDRHHERVSLAPPSGWLPDFVPRFPQPGWQVVGDTAGVALGGVWICVWMDLMCKHWASVIWWHIKGGLPVGLPTRRLYVDIPPAPPAAHIHTDTRFMYLCTAAAQLKGWGWGRRPFGLGGWWSIGVRRDWRVGGRGDIWRAMMLIHKFK